MWRLGVANDAIGAAFVDRAEQIAVHGRHHAVVAAQVLQPIGHGGVGHQRARHAGDAKEPRIGSHERDLGHQSERAADARDHRVKAPAEREQVDDATSGGARRERPSGEAHAFGAARPAHADHREEQRPARPAPASGGHDVAAPAEPHAHTSVPAVPATASDRGGQAAGHRGARRSPAARPAASASTP